MNIRLPIFMALFIVLNLFFLQPYPCLGQTPSTGSPPLIVKSEKESKEDLKSRFDPAIEEFEKEKLAKLKKNIGRRLMFVKTTNPPVFYESPDALEKKLNIKREKEGFVITEVVQNQSGTMNFYKVKFDPGEIGYLGADGNNLEIKIKEGSLLSGLKSRGSKKKSVSQSKALVSHAVGLVKNHPTSNGSVEKRMMDEKAKSFPNMKWKYEAREIGRNKYRVTQYATEGSGPPLIRTWTVDFPSNTVKPENLAAKAMYR